MSRHRLLFVIAVLVAMASSACDDLPLETPTMAPGAIQTAVAQIAAQGTLTCPLATPAASNVPMAARVNGIGIPLDRYNREVAQAQAALSLQKYDPKSTSGQEALKGVRQQVLDQLIDEAVIGQQAQKEGVKISPAELNAELTKMTQDAGGIAKLAEYMVKNRLSAADLCGEIRDQYYGAAMLVKVTSTVPKQAAQVHVRQILVSSPAQAKTVRDRVIKGEDFAALARQFSIDEGTKAKGGDMGWYPKGILDPKMDAVIFGLAPGQVSDVITTTYGYHVMQVIEKDPARALSPEAAQTIRQFWFLIWVQAIRSGAKIERLVQP